MQYVSNKIKVRQKDFFGLGFILLDAYCIKIYYPIFYILYFILLYIYIYKEDP